MVPKPSHTYFLAYDSWSQLRDWEHLEDPVAGWSCHGQEPSRRPGTCGNSGKPGDSSRQARCLSLSWTESWLSESVRNRAKGKVSPPAGTEQRLKTRSNASILQKSIHNMGQTALKRSQILIRLVMPREGIFYSMVSIGMISTTNDREPQIGINKFIGSRNWGPEGE